MQEWARTGFSIQLCYRKLSKKIRMHEGICTLFYFQKKKICLTVLLEVTDGILDVYKRQVQLLYVKNEQIFLWVP